MGGKCGNRTEDKAAESHEGADAGRAGRPRGVIEGLYITGREGSDLSTLMDILQCLGVSVSEFFTEEPEEQIVFTKEDYFIKKDEENENTIEWIVPNAQKNQMEPILLKLEPGGSTDPDNPHEGEEFGYVLNGAVTIHLGNKVYRAKKGETFYYVSGKQHYLTSKVGATVLWISSPPTF